MSQGESQKSTAVPQNNTNNVIFVGVLLLLVGSASWKASEYVNENSRIHDEVTKLRTENADLKKELDKCRSTPTNWRPGTPIGSPAGSTDK